MKLTPRELWVAAYRFIRSMDHVQINGSPRQAINGLYPSWMPQYREFLRMCNDARQARTCNYRLEERLCHAARVKEIEERLTWCGYTTEKDVKHCIAGSLRDLYNVW